ncbi:DUF6929 family protein [Flavobacterium rhizosphaerae]|uniref:Uncharacterized protein n=1 Tax=Flavobacterium rhizosphaerae TaxID=3163298 RepID=A0ABW8YTV4_9FLAO
MQKFTLEVLFHIIGISAASGLFYTNNALYITSDNSHILYEYHTDTQKLDKTALVADTYTGPLENIPKKDKPDYEALAVHGNDMYLFGSGSTENRMLIGHVDYTTKKVYPNIEAIDLYMVMQDFAELAPEDFNIEAAVNDGDTWYLFNRGNGPKQQNIVYTLTGDISDTAFQIIYNEIKLPKINGTRPGFTDAVKVADKLYFIAAAEKTTSTYEDGTITGTLMGRIDIETMKVDFTIKISDTKKFEGITLYKDNRDSLEFLLCEDGDNSNANETDIFKLTVNK